MGNIPNAPNPRNTEPIDHIVSIDDLKLTDHVYHHERGLFGTWHHGIISYLPDEDSKRTYDSIRVITITMHDDYNDIEEISLMKFLDGYKLRRVKYTVSAWYESLHGEGSCHRQIKSNPQIIIERYNAIKNEFESINNDFFSSDSLILKQLTSDHFSYWCSTGIVHFSITETRIATILEQIEDKRLGVTEELIFDNTEVTQQTNDKIDTTTFDINHIVSIHDLKVTDHIYYHVKTMLSQHHGIVIYIPSEYEKRTEDNIKVLEMNKGHKINRISLREFLKGHNLRRVKYDVSEQYQSFHVAGSSHIEPKNDPQTILERCNNALQESGNSRMKLLGIDNEHFAIYCMTGNVHAVNGQIAMIESALQSAGNKSITEIMKCVERSVIKLASETASEVATEIAETTVTKMAGATTAATTTTVEVAKEGATKGVVSSFAAASLVGISVAVESIATGYKIYKYKNSVGVLWDDTKMELIKGWSSAGFSIGAGLICLVLGVSAWPSALIGIGISFLSWIGFKIYGKYYEKSPKEKLFNERGLKLNSSIREKKGEIRLINKEIKEERLHPDKFKLDLPQKYVKIYEFKKRPFDITIKCGEIGEIGKLAIIDNVEMSQWIKGIRSGMIVYSINNCIVYDKNEFDEIKAMFDASNTIQIGLFMMKKVEKEIKRRTEKFYWLENVKKVIKKDIYEYKRNKRGEKKLRKPKKKQSAPLAITWSE